MMEVPASGQHWSRQFLRREAHPVIQFVKYGIAGGVATGTQVLVFFALSLWVWPAMLADTGIDALLVNWLGVEMVEISPALRQRNFVINNVLAFVLANVVAYGLNVYWVFHPGRHRRHVEMALFFIVSAVSMGIGVQIGVGIMRLFQATTTVAQIGNVLAAVLINFVCRKYFVFKR